MHLEIFFELSGPGGSSEDFFFFKIPTYLVLALPLHDFFTFRTSKYILTHNTVCFYSKKSNKIQQYTHMRNIYYVLVK